eukprot:gene39911-52685_t
MELRIDIKETKEEISAAKLVGDTARQDSLLTYLIELQRKENILLQQTLAQAPTGVPNVTKLYKVTAQCKKSRKHIGFRAGAYLCCSDFCGFFDKDESSSFKYSETGDLKISLLFKSEDNARKFINKMIEHCLFFK